MKSITEHLRESILHNSGCVKSEPLPDLEELRITEWDSEFETLMRNRLIMGAFRYGLMRDATKYKRSASIRARLKLYEESGNGEHLVDIANLCLLEFNQKAHPSFHWASADDGIHCKQV